MTDLKELQIKYNKHMNRIDYIVEDEEENPESPVFEKHPKIITVKFAIKCSKSFVIEFPQPNFGVGCPKTYEWIPCSNHAGAWICKILVKDDDPYKDTIFSFKEGIDYPPTFMRFIETDITFDATNHNALAGLSSPYENDEC
jgi:hypothetical protein